MICFCEVCDLNIKPKSKYKNFKSSTHKEFDKCKQRKLRFENPDKIKIDGLINK